jgi:hypothetical protein
MSRVTECVLPSMSKFSEGANETYPFSVRIGKPTNPVIKEDRK